MSPVVEQIWKGRSLHFVGIGGAGMSGLARIALELGATVTGSDRTTGGVIEDLCALGAAIHADHNEAHVPADAELVYSSAIAADNHSGLWPRAGGRRNSIGAICSVR